MKWKCRIGKKQIWIVAEVEANNSEDAMNLAITELEKAHTEPTNEFYCDCSAELSEE